MAELTMTLDQFCEALAACKDQFEWRLRGDDLRGDCIADRGICCPITAVYYAHTREVKDEWQTLSSGEALGLSYDDIDAIVGAADNTFTEPDIRARLLVCVGLQEGA